jgi:hypothetical protein
MDAWGQAASYGEEDGADTEFADYALLGVIPVFSLRASEKLPDLLKANGEPPPLRYPRALAQPQFAIFPGSRKRSSM